MDTSSTPSSNPPSKATHLSYLHRALSLAHNSPPKPTNFRVGALLVSFPSLPSSQQTILSTGYTLELPGNTHAEQCALTKLASSRSVPESSLHTILEPELNVTLYTTLEPCGKRLSGNKSCVERIIDTRAADPAGGIRKVVFGAKEPGTFVQDSASCQMLDAAGVAWEFVPGLEEEIMSVAKAGHEKKKETSESGTNVDDISQEERKRQEALPRNPKKRMMEVPPGSG